MEVHKKYVCGLKKTDQNDNCHYFWGTVHESQRKER